MRRDMEHEIVLHDPETGTKYTDRVAHEMFAQAVVNAYWARYVITTATHTVSSYVKDGVTMPITLIHLEGIKRR